MQVTIPPPFEPLFSFVSLPLVAGLGIACLLSLALWGKRYPIAHMSDGLPQGVLVYNPNRFLALLIAVLIFKLLLTLSVISGFIYYAPLLARFHVVPVNFLIGPLIYFYTRTITSPTPIQYSHRHLLHLAPFVCGLAMHIPLLVDLNADAFLLVLYDVPYQMRASIDMQVDGLLGSYGMLQLSGMGITQTLVINSFYGVLFLYYISYTVAGYAQAISLCAYTGYCFHLLRLHRRTIQQLASTTEGLELKWMFSFLLLALLSVALYAVQMILDGSGSFETYPHPLQYAPYYVIVYMLFFIGNKALVQPQIFSPELRVAFREIQPGTREIDTTDKGLARNSANRNAGKESSSDKYRNSILTPELSLEIAREIRMHVDTHKPFLDANLTLAELARQTGLPARVISQVLNETLQQNFFDFINEFRIEAFKAAFNNTGSDSQSILRVAFDSGFNSKSGFYNVFKKHEGMSPSKWRHTRRSEG